MNEDDTRAIRRQRLRAWLESNGGPRAVCARRGLDKSAESYISQILSGKRDLTGKSARNMENRLGMDSGHLEPQPPNAAAAGLSPIAIELARLFDTLQGQIARTVAYNAATEAILKVMREPEPPPSDTPSPSAKPKKLRA